MTRIPHWYLNHPRLPFAERAEVLGFSCAFCGAPLPSGYSNRSACAKCSESKRAHRERSHLQRLLLYFRRIYDPLADATMRDVLLARGLSEVWGEVSDRMESLFECCVFARANATPEARAVIDAFVRAYRDAALDRAGTNLVSFAVTRLRGYDAIHGKPPRDAVPNKTRIHVLQSSQREEG